MACKTLVKLGIQVRGKTARTKDQTNLISRHYNMVAEIDEDYIHRTKARIKKRQMDDIIDAYQLLLKATFSKINSAIWSRMLA